MKQFSSWHSDRPSYDKVNIIFVFTAHFIKQFVGLGLMFTLSFLKKLEVYEKNVRKFLFLDIF